MLKRISRRTVLRGAGAALALPWLERMSSAAPAAAGQLTEPPLRSVFMYMPNGVVPEHWTPAQSSDSVDIYGRFWQRSAPTLTSNVGGFRSTQLPPAMRGRALR